MKFFIPHLADDRQAEQEWAQYVRACHAPAINRRAYSMTYEHERSLFEVRVGQSRSEHRPTNRSATPGERSVPLRRLTPRAAAYSARGSDCRTPRVGGRGGPSVLHYSLL